jgi:cytochrome c-type biogenesis protein CcsB
VVIPVRRIALYSVVGLVLVGLMQGAVRWFEYQYWMTDPSALMLTTLAFLADASFAIAFGVGIMYLIQERQLKRKNPGAFYRRLPNLDVLDELDYKAIALGFPLLTLAIVTGSIWANSAWGYYWGWEPKEIWSLITWLIYAAYLHARLVGGWRGRKAAYLAVIGFAIVIFTFLGVNLLLPGQHAFK